MYPREALDLVRDPEFPAEPRHQQFGLVTRLTLEGHGVVVREFLEAEPLLDEADLGGADAPDGW